MVSSFFTPKLTANDDNAEIARWCIDDKALVKKGQDIVELSLSKAVYVLQSEFTGYIKQHARQGELVSVGQLLATFHESKEAIPDDKPISRPTMSRPGLEVNSSIEYSASSPPGKFSHTRLSKAALAQLEKEQLALPEGQGWGLVTTHVLKSRKMLETFVEKPEPKLSLRCQPVGKIKQLEIASLTAGQSGNINSSLTVTFEGGAVFEMIRKRNALNGQVLPLVLFELSRLLEKFPLFTAFFREGNIYFYDRIDIGVAMDMGKGLKVVTLRDANRHLPIDFLEELTRYGMLYLEDKLTAECLTGSTITVTDLSGMGITHFQPLLNRDQSVIIGMGGKIEPGSKMLSLTVVFDHRVLTGREVALFLNELKKNILSYAN